MKNIIIVDLDGTIQQIGDRKKYLKTIPPDYDRFHNEFESDRDITHVCRMISAMCIFHDVVFVTQRPIRLFKQTGDYIGRYTGLTSFKLYMRANDDSREPWIVKPQLITDNINIDNILFAIDDNDKVIKAYCKLGIECIKVIDPVQAVKPKRMRRRRGNNSNK